MATKFSSPPDQLFECRDCPARCCRVPWSIRFSSEEIERYVSEPWVRERAGDEAMRVLARGVLPMREHERRLQCVFLDDDRLCSLQKQFGHSYIPRACQAFPFGFIRDEKGVALAQLSRLCPSIRDNYGKPVHKQLRAKLDQKGGIERMTTAMSTQSRVVLSQPQYLRVARSWAKALADDNSPAGVLAHIYDQMAVFDRAIPEGVERASDAAVAAALEQARAHAPEPLDPRKTPSFHARVLYSYLLGNLCYPSRVRQPHRVGRASFAWFQAMRSLGNKLAWMRGRGTVDMLFAPGPVALQRVRDVEPFLAGPQGALVRDYLCAVLDRRQVFSQPRYLLAVVVDLCLATVLISRFARCLAVASERQTVTPEDVREGISVAELVLLSHVTLAEEGKTMKNLRLLLLSDRNKLRQLLASET
jgi:lysine-N-methylase